MGGGGWQGAPGLSRGVGDMRVLRGSTGLKASPGTEGVLGHRASELQPGTLHRITWARLPLGGRPPLTSQFSWVKGEDGFLTG